MAFLIGERPQEIARRAVPKQNRTVTGASRDRAIRRGYRESTDRIFVISDGDLRATAHLPEPKRLISAYSHGAFPVGTEGRRVLERIARCGSNRRRRTSFAMAAR